MNYLQNEKIVNETGVLPPIIADKEVFAKMTNKERTWFYKLLDKTIAANGEEYRRTKDLYKMMLHYPEQRLNKAFLENKFKNVQKWHFYVEVFQQCLEEFVTAHLHSYQELHKKYKTGINKTEDRITTMQGHFVKYLKITRP